MAPINKRSQRLMQIEVDHSGPAYFISRYRNFRWVGKSQRTINKGDGSDPETIPGVAVQFEEGVAALPLETPEDWQTLAMMLSDAKSFGTDFCVDPADRNGFWKKFHETYPEEVLAKFFPTGLPKALQVEMQASVAAAIAEAVPNSKLQRNVIHAAKGRIPTKDGGRERLTEEQAAQIAALSGSGA